MSEDSGDGLVEPQFELRDELSDPFTGHELLVPDTLPDFLTDYGDDLLAPDFE